MTRPKGVLTICSSRSTGCNNQPKIVVAYTRVWTPRLKNLKPLDSLPNKVATVINKGSSKLTMNVNWGICHIVGSGGLFWLFTNRNISLDLDLKYKNLLRKKRSTKSIE